MRTKRTILVAVLALSLAVFGATQVGAYGLFTMEGGNCSQCHDTWPGAQHDLHGSISCTVCHVGGVGANPVAVTTCTGCHPAADMLELHSPLEAPNGQFCGLCHEGIAAEGHSFSELKELFE